MKLIKRYYGAIYFSVPIHVWKLSIHIVSQGLSAIDELHVPTFSRPKISLYRIYLLKFCKLIFDSVAWQRLLKGFKFMEIFYNLVGRHSNRVAAPCSQSNSKEGYKKQRKFWVFTQLQIPVTKVLLIKTRQDIIGQDISRQ